MTVPKLTPIKKNDYSLKVSNYDALIVVYNTGLNNTFKTNSTLKEYSQNIMDQCSVDESIGKQITLLYSKGAPGNRILLAPVKSNFSDVDDVRIYGDLGKSVMKRSIEAGIKKPIIYFASQPLSKNGEINKEFVNYQEVTLLGALSALYVPLEAREFFKKASSVAEIGVMSEVEDGNLQKQLKTITAYQEGRQLAQDIGGGSPERTNPLQCAELIKEAFKGTDINVTVIDDYETIQKEYPLMAAVGRASIKVERHRPCVVKLAYKSPCQSEVNNNLFFVGKGVTFDSGGMDVKTDGHMRGMCRDKGGAAICAGLIYIASKLNPTNVNINATLGFVRNSVGSNSYVCDEVITSRSGRRVLVANTDAEGRMTMADLLTEAKENAISSGVASTAKLFTIATLTGHVVRAYGPYPAAVENGPASNAGVGRTLQDIGQIWGDPFEISRIRREDYMVVEGNGVTEDVIQGNDRPSTMTNRGHQFPVAFLNKTSRLDEHGTNSDLPIAYTHLDIAAVFDTGAASWGLGEVTGAPIIAIASSFL